MPIYQITAPDGRKLKITAPDGATQEQVLAYAQQNYGGQQSGADFGNVQGQASTKRQDGFLRQTAENLLGQSGANVLDAAQHHAMALPHGIAQFVEHGANAAANLLPEGNSVRGYVNRTVAADDAAMAQREADYQARVPDGIGASVGAVAGEVAPFLVAAPARALSAVGERAAGFLPEAWTGTRKVANFAAQGGALAAAQPVTGGNYGSSKARQVGAGATLGGALPVAASGIGGLARLAAPVFAPGRVANSQLARLYGTDASTLSRLEQAPQFVPGETVTAAQALQTPQAVMVEKALRNRPDMRGMFAEADNANNARRLDVVRGHAGDAESLAAARTARREADAPFRNANLPEQGSPLVDASGVVDTLKRLALSANATVRGAAREHLSLLRSQTDGQGRVPAFLLDDIRQNAGGMLAKHAPMGGGASAEQAKYGPVTSQIIRSLDAAIPGYRDSLSAYRANSVPVNTMEASQRILAPVDSGGLNSAGDPVLTLGRLNTGLNRADKARYGLSPGARAEIGNVRNSLQRGSVSNSITSPGSDTAYNLASDGWLASQLYGPAMQGPTNKTRGLAALVGGLAGHKLGIPGAEAAGAGLGLYINKAAEAVNSRIAQRVGKGAVDSKEAARMIREFVGQHPTERNKLLQRYPQWALILGERPALPAPR